MEKLGVNMWTSLSWIRIGSNSGSCIVGFHESQKCLDQASNFQLIKEHPVQLSQLHTVYHFHIYVQENICYKQGLIVPYYLQVKGLIPVVVAAERLYGFIVCRIGGTPSRGFRDKLCSMRSIPGRKPYLSRISDDRCTVCTVPYLSSLLPASTSNFVALCVKSQYLGFLTVLLLSPR